MNGIVNKTIEASSSGYVQPIVQTLEARPYGTVFDISKYGFMAITGLSAGYYLWLFPKEKWGYSNNDGGIITGTVRYVMKNNASVVYTINFDAQTLTSSSSEFAYFICF